MPPAAVNAPRHSSHRIVPQNMSRPQRGDKRLSNRSRGSTTYSNGHTEYPMAVLGARRGGFKRLTAAAALPQRGNIHWIGGAVSERQARCQ